MTDWLDDLLDTQVGESPPEGFAERVVAQARAESPKGRLLRFPRIAAGMAAGFALLAIGFWLGRGGPDLHPLENLPGGPDVAELDVDEIYADRELLENLDLLSDEQLELAFRDGVAGTWVLDAEMPTAEEEE